MADEIIDGEIIDESDTQALERYERTRSAMQRTDACAITIVGPKEGIALVLREDYHYIREEIAHDALIIGLYNKSGAAPLPEEFAPAYQWSDEVRREMGLEPRRKAPKLLETSTATPFRAAEHVGLGVLKSDGRYNHRARVTAATTAYVTHFTIGRRNGRIITAGQFVEPIRVLEGNAIVFGLDLAGSYALNGVELQQRIGWLKHRKAIEDGTGSES